MLDHNKHLRAFKVRYISPTCFKGARVQIHDQRNNVRRYASYDYSIGNVTEQAIAFLEARGITVDAFAELHKGDMLLLSSDFKTQILGQKGEE